MEAEQGRLNQYEVHTLPIVIYGPAKPSFNRNSIV